MTIERYAAAIVSFCKANGGSVTSWVRSSKRNRLVGGVADSHHLSGLGADVVYDAPVSELVATEVARALGLRLIRERDHDHLQPL